MTKIAPGIRRLPKSVQVYARVKGKFVSETYPLTMRLSDLKDKRARLIALHKYGTPNAPPDEDETTFAADASRYLALVMGMPSFEDRTHHIREWVRVFGHRTRKSITAAEIRAQLGQWAINGRVDGKPLSPASLNLRRTALMALYSVLDGKSAPNIVRDVPRFDESSSADVNRAQPVAVWYRLLARIGSYARPDSKTKARLRVILWTGLPHSLLAQLTPGDIDWKGQRIRVSRRKKGTGTPPQWIPVVPQAIAALKRFAAVKAWGEFSASAMHSSLALAVRHENARRARMGLKRLPKIRPYDARHTFAAEQAKVVHDEWLLDAFLVSRQRRYREGAKEQRMAAARDQFAAALRQA